MAEFILVDLRSQMPYLPRIMRTWERERILRWLRVHGEVVWHGDPDKDYVRYLQARLRAGQRHDPDSLSLLQAARDTSSLRPLYGLWTSFVLRKSGELFIPGTGIRAWQADVL